MTDAIETIAKEIERATDDEAQFSKQPRFGANTTAFWGAMLNFVRLAEIEAVPYSSNSMQRDAWLRTFWRLEPRLAGVVNAVTLIDANRGWEIIGGRNQVKRYTETLHAADGGAGWRMFMRRSSLSYWTTDMGAIIEMGREGKGGPMRALYHVDSARCRLTGIQDQPLEYLPVSAGTQRWLPSDFFRVCSMPSDDEQFNGLGYCAVSRCVEIVRLLYAVLMHDQEQVAARAPKGLLLLHNISEPQWDDSLEMRDARLDSLDRKYYGGVQVICSSGSEEPSATLVGLSQLPANFDAKVFLDLSMYAYALCFGYDPSEFWPVQFGSLGRGTEGEMQHRKASGKGGLDFILSFQEQLQLEFPPTLQFEFEQRDDEGEIAMATLESAKAKPVLEMYNAGLIQGQSVIDRNEARTLLAERGLIPDEWTAQEEQATATDTEDAESQEQAPIESEPIEEPPIQSEAAEGEGVATSTEGVQAERWLDTERVQRAMTRFPSERIVRYSWPSGVTRTLWRPRTKPRFFPVVERADEGVLYDRKGVRITEEDVDRAVAEAKARVGDEFAQILEAEKITPEQEAKWGTK